MEDISENIAWCNLQSYGQFSKAWSKIKTSLHYAWQNVHWSCSFINLLVCIYNTIPPYMSQLCDTHLPFKLWVICTISPYMAFMEYVCTIQIKGNSIPVHVLQVKYCQVKITSCVQYLNWHPLRSCPHQANYLACAPANITLFCMNF